MAEAFFGFTVGYVNADSHSIKDGQFRPMNGAQGRFHPGDRRSVSTVSSNKTMPAFLPELNDGEFYQVQEEMDKSEGRLGTRPAGNFLNYQDAYRASAGKGVQGSAGEILIAVPRKVNVMAQSSSGAEVLMAVNTEYSLQNVHQRLVIEVPEED